MAAVTRYTGNSFASLEDERRRGTYRLKSLSKPPERHHVAWRVCGSRMHATASIDDVRPSRPRRDIFARLFFFFFFFFFISPIADGPHHYHPVCGHKGSSHLSPVHALHFFIAMQVQHSYNSSNQWLNFTYSRSNAFRYERKNTNPTLVRIADVQLTY